ncbi:MAG: hypothetical protein QOG67_2647 [Verrucomicrobiota bacterium]
MTIGTAQAALKTWNNTGTDFNAAGSWTGGSPSGNNVASFNAAAVTQPKLSSPVSVSGLFFSGTGSSGYDITNTTTEALTLTGTSTSGSSGTSDSSAAAIRNEISSGTNTIDVPLVLSSTSGTSTFVQSGAGTLVVNGAISGNALSLRGGAGVIQLNGVNSFAAASIDTAGETLVIGNNSALGAGTFTINSTSTIQAGGGSRIIPNAVVLAGNTTISGVNAITFNGSVTSSGSNSRTLTVSNTGGATLAGNVFLQEAAATGRTFTILGTSAVNITGVVTDGGTGPALLKYTGSNVLTLNNTNTYSGGTQETISGSTIVANHDGALGSGNISLTAATVTLTLQNGAVNNYIANSANLSLLNTDTVNLNYNGTDTIGELIINNVAQAIGTYGAVGSGAMNELPEFMGTGFLNVTASIPEPATWMLMGVGLLLGAQRLRRKS